MTACGSVGPLGFRCSRPLGHYSGPHSHSRGGSWSDVNAEPAICGDVLRDGPLAYLCTRPVEHTDPHSDGLGYAWPQGQTPRLAHPAAIVLVQTSPQSWSVDVTVCGVKRYISSGLPTRREAMASAVDWLEKVG